jgi:formamidopyrimidine-DNA glycosylase
MPELPEVESACLGALPFALNKKIRKVIVRERKLREYIPENLSEIEDSTIINIFRKAKYIIINLDTGKDIIIHLGMSGSFTVKKKTDEIKKHSHVDIELESDYVLRFNDPRKFGMVLLENNYQDNKYIQKCGLEPFDDKFLKNYLFDLSRNKKMPIKNFLMKNDIVVGVGNIYASECLFKAKIRPDKPSKEISKKEYLNLSKIIQKTLRDSINKGGTTLKDHQSGLNKEGDYQHSLLVYGQKKCSVCDNDITIIKQNNRSSFFCEKCQK